MAPACRVSGRVLRGGQPFVGAVVILDQGVSGGLAKTNERGEYFVEDLMPGTYRVQARIFGRPTGRSTLAEVSVGPQDPVTDFDVTLQAGRIVSGFVTDDDSQPLRGALVGVRGRTGEVVTTKASGAFEVELRPRDTELVVSFGGPRQPAHRADRAEPEDGPHRAGVDQHEHAGGAHLGLAGTAADRWACCCA